MTGRPQSWIARWAIAINLVLAGCVLIGMATTMWWQPILADEWDFYRAAVNWPQNRYLIPHPPAYVHLTQLAFLLFGQSVGSARLIGVATTLVSLALIPRLTAAFFNCNKRDGWLTIGAIWLYALNPMTAQNMMLLDIDNTLLTPALLSMLWAWKSAQNRPFWQRIATLSLASTAALWVKLPTPVLLMGCITLFHMLRREIRRAGEVILATLASGVAFLATFGLYGRLTGFTFAAFGPTFGKAPRGVQDVTSMLLRFPQGMGVFVMWLSLPLTALLVVAVGEAVRRLVRQRLEDRDLLTIYVVAVLLSYALIIPPAWGYPRYQAPIVPVIAMLAAALIIPACRALPQRVRFVVAGLGALAFCYKLVAIGDPLWSLYAVTFETSTGDLMYRLNQGIGDALRLALPIGAVLAITHLLPWRRKVRRLPLTVFALGMLSLAHTASTTAVQVPANYSTRYRYTYNYADLLQTIDDLRQTGGHVLAVKDVLYYTGLPGEEIYRYVCPNCTPQALLDKLRSTRVNALAWTTKEDNRSPNVTRDPRVLQALNACYTRVTHGVFIVYLLKPDGACP